MQSLLLSIEVCSIASYRSTSVQHWSLRACCNVSKVSLIANGEYNRRPYAACACHAEVSARSFNRL